MKVTTNRNELNFDFGEHKRYITKRELVNGVLRTKVYMYYDRSHIIRRTPTDIENKNRPQ